MKRSRHILIDGKPYLWREIIELRRQQRQAVEKVEQPALFELREDHKPEPERTAASRYTSPTLFTLIT